MNTPIFPTGDELISIGIPKLRFFEAWYFFERYKNACGEEAASATRDDWFRWIAYSDAYLGALVSIQDYATEGQRNRLLERDAEVPNVFRFLKLIRNETTHQCIFAAPREGGPVSRVINLGPVSWVQPRILIDNFRPFLAGVRQRYEAANRMSGIHDADETGRYLDAVVARNANQILLHDLFKQGLERVAETCDFQ